MKNYQKYLRRAGVLLMIVCVLTVSGSEKYVGKVLATSSNGSNLSELEDKRQETLDEINDLKESISDVKEEIQDLKTEKTDIQNSINALDQKSDTLAKKIEDFETKIEEKANDIIVTQEKLEEARIACDEQYAAMKKRIQFIYENSSKSTWELLLSAESIPEALNRADYVFSMSDYENRMMDKLINTKEEIALHEATLKAEHEELEMMKAELESQKQQITVSIDAKKKELTQKATEINEASGERKEYEQQLAKQERLLGEIEDQIAKAAQPDVYEGTATGFIWPCPSYTRISSYFGPRPQPVPGASTNHKGVDLAAPYGANILASAAGVVTTSKYSASAGNYVVIAHGNGVSTVYMHASSLLVSVGQTVAQGQVIAKVGSTGYSSGNHLHFGVIKNGTYVDPLGYVSP